MRLLIDTNIFISILRKEQETLKRFVELAAEAQFFYNPIIEAEILQGAKEKSVPNIEYVLSQCTCLVSDCETGHIAGKLANKYLKSHHSITLDDYLIAATCVQHNLTLWTKNKKHFPMLEDIV